MKARTRTASCSCGQLSARVTGEPLRVTACHCRACQRRTGNVFGVQARFPRESVVVSGRGQDYVRQRDEGAPVTFTFCPDCGSTVYYRGADLGEFTMIPVGAFAQSSFPAPSFSVHEHRMHPWVRLPADVEHLA